MNNDRVTCRRCRQPYRLPNPQPLLASCPHCGTSPQPLLRHARSNTLATLLSLTALVLLGFAFLTPFMQMSALGQQRVVSLFQGIAQLYRDQHHLIATIVLGFSVIFPVTKLLMILAATSRFVPASQQLRHRLHRIAAFTGKYSLLDVLVLAILIVLVKFEGIATVQIRLGTILFTLAVLLSLAAGLCIKLDPPQTPEPST